MIEFEVGGHNYRSGGINARTQFHVARRLAPIYSGLAGAMDLSKPDLSGIATTIASMPDADVDYVLDACLAVVTRQQAGGTGWSPIKAPFGGAMMFEDIGMPEMMQIAWKVVEDSLSGFFRALPSASPTGADPSQG